MLITVLSNEQICPTNQQVGFIEAIAKAFVVARDFLLHKWKSLQVKAMSFNLTPTSGQTSQS